MPYRYIWFLQSHRTIGRLISRGPFRSWMSRVVWAELEADETFMAEMVKGRADLDAGRWYSFNTKTGETTPNPDWPKDDGVQLWPSERLTDTWKLR